MADVRIVLIAGPNLHKTEVEVMVQSCYRHIFKTDYLSCSIQQDKVNEEHTDHSSTEREIHMKERQDFHLVALGAFVSSTLSR